MKQINPKHINTLMSLVNQSPYFELLSMRLCSLGAGSSRVELDIEQKHLNPFGTVHGGVYSSIIDTAAYWAAYCELEENAGFTSIDLSVSNLSMSAGGRLIAEGKSLKIGKSLCLCEARLMDEDGRLLAHGTSKLMILQNRQSVNDVLKMMGHNELPPKLMG